MKKMLVLTSLSKRSSLLGLFAFAFLFSNPSKTEPDSSHKFLQCKSWLSLLSPKELSHTDGVAESKEWCCHTEPSLKNILVFRL